MMRTVRYLLLSIAMLVLLPGAFAEALTAPTNIVRDVSCHIFPQGTQVLIRLQQPGRYKSLKRDDEKTFILEIKNCYFPGVQQVIQTFDTLVAGIRVAQVHATIVQIVLTMHRGTQEQISWSDEAGALVVQITPDDQRPGPAAPPAPDPRLSLIEEKALREEKRILQQLASSADVSGLSIDTIVIDPGHGGFDPGAVGPTGLQEKEVNLDLALRLAGLLRNNTQLQVYLTRTGDYYVPLSARTIIANQYGADLFISIHTNAGKKESAHGVEIYYPSEKASDAEAARVAALENAAGTDDEFFNENISFVNIEEVLFRIERKLYWEDSRKIAGALSAGLGSSLGLVDRGVKYADFFVLRKARMPSVLFETAYISNPREEQLLRSEDFRQKVAEELFRRVQGMVQGVK